LTPDLRLNLFIQVCKEVQHAQPKGAFTRDLKPNNVLVAEFDDHQIPKVIDFGVAKTLGQRLTDKTMFTHLGQILGIVTFTMATQHVGTSLGTVGIFSQNVCRRYNSDQAFFAVDHGKVMYLCFEHVASRDRQCRLIAHRNDILGHIGRDRRTDQSERKGPSPIAL
jgi:serine/threonine protein kinase